MSLAVVIPSRARPANTDTVLTACERTCVTRPVVIVAVDRDDPDLPGYRQVCAGRAELLVVDPPAGHVGAINAAARHAITTVDPFAVVKLDDDHRPATPGWDGAYLDALTDLGTGLCYGNDLLQGRNMPTAPGITADIVDALGFMAPPGLRHLYCDDFWRDLATQAGCIRYLPTVIVEHVHPGAGKAVWDEGYARVNSPERYAADGAAYRHYQQTRMAADVHTVTTLMSGVRG